MMMLAKLAGEAALEVSWNRLNVGSTEHTERSRSPAEFLSGINVFSDSVVLSLSWQASTS
jgi:hypothetical protein